MSRIYFFLFSFAASIAVAVVVFDLQDQVRQVITGKDVEAPQMMPAEPEEESQFAAYLDKAGHVVKTMFGLKESEKKSDLQKLMDRRRKETAPVESMFSF